VWRQREETFKREVYGAGTSLNGRATLLGRPVTFVAGIEGFASRPTSSSMTVSTTGDGSQARCMIAT
jgi:hypothetical protein